MLLFALAVLLAAACCSAEPEFNCLKQPGKSDTPPSPDTLLPSDYTVLILTTTTDFSKNVTVTSEMRETRYLKEVGIVKQTREYSGMQWIFRENDFIYYDDKRNCSTFKSWKEHPTPEKPYSVPDSIVTRMGINLTSVLDLLRQTETAKTVWLKNDTSAVNGVPAQHWITCMKSDAGPNSWVEMDVAISTQVKPSDAAVNNPVLLQIVIQQYNEVDAKSTVLVEQFSLDVSSVHPSCNQTRETCLLPPKGVFCDNMAATQTVPEFPKKFEMRLQYADISAKRIDTAEIIYDGDNEVVGYSLDVKKDVDEPFIGNISVDTGYVRVVHDVKHGIQYVLSGEGDSCINVAALSNYSGDVVPDQFPLKLKNATDFILGVNSNQFVFVGQRSDDSGMPADVFISRNEHLNVTTELWYSPSGWTVENRLTSGDNTKPTLLEIRTYHFNDSGHAVRHIVQKVQSLVDYTGRSTPWLHLSVYPCLQVVDDSFLFVQVREKLADVKKVGMNNFQDALTDHIAQLGNVSSLRIAKFFVKDLQDHVVAFFILGNVSGVAPQEMTLADARDKINKTISHDASEFIVIDEAMKSTKFNIENKALGDIPSTWTGQGAPTIVKTGYSGGSMFVLALFMLLLGAGIGVGGAFFLWKRQRAGAGGLTYQVFE